MNYYPGQGLTIGAAILGSTLGQEYATKTAGDLCKIYGLLKDVQGDAAGVAGTAIEIVNGVMTTVAIWAGVKVTATITVADVISGSVITIERVDVTTNEAGYFEIPVLRGLTIIVTCPIFGKSVTVNTTGQPSIDISTLF
jgi:hypothetical protein